MVNERHTQGQVGSNADLDGKDIHRMSLKECTQRFADHIKRIMIGTGSNPVQIFWSFIDWSFWMTMWETRALAESLFTNGDELVPYEKEECRKNAFQARDFLVEKNLGVSFGIMANLWMRAAAGHGADFLHTLTREKSLQGMLIKELGQFFTPPTLTNLIAQMVNPKETQDGEWMLEPTAGFGAMMFSDWQKFGGMDKPIGSRYYAAAELSPRTARACWLGMVIQQMAGYVDCMNSLSMERFAPRWFTPQMLMCMKFKTEGHKGPSTEHVRRSFDGEQRTVL